MNVRTSRPSRRRRRPWRSTTVIIATIVVIVSVVSTERARAIAAGTADIVVQAGVVMWLGIGLLVGGVALLLLIGRRRGTRGDVR
jgi:protein-S-isoprenylcysteine O-methyltransferase Ste14